jgi:hypothetical protein
VFNKRDLEATFVVGGVPVLPVHVGVAAPEARGKGRTASYLPAYPVNVKETFSMPGRAGITGLACLLDPKYLARLGIISALSIISVEFAKI